MLASGAPSRAGTFLEAIHRPGVEACDAFVESCDATRGYPVESCDTLK